MLPIEIREVTSEQKAEYAQFFTGGLLADGDYFRITPADECGADFPTSGLADSFTLGAFQESTLVGVVSFTRDGATREKLRHKGILFRMFVDGRCRGRGVGKRLITALLDRAIVLDGIEQISLTVVTKNAIAIKLYEQFRFRIVGTEPNAIKWNGQYFSEHQMVSMLRHE